MKYGPPSNVTDIIRINLDTLMTRQNGVQALHLSYFLFIHQVILKHTEFNMTHSQKGHSTSGVEYVSTLKAGILLKSVFNNPRGNDDW